ncbi:bile acid:sodium symporter family protein [Vreelandella malpeensis]|uniref:Bile acid:sodium symporter n=1 Tax=Vreelandella malpeensis TaxID=1172368 RepID=A0ABS8DVF5_9GAMM|nr:bile acid:sodium symporter [Halomonas malpeensis]MCB8890174.1 bile acid:sodium symporter [Halomonas malpeensis]
MRRCILFVEAHLLWWVIGATLLGLGLPATGQMMAPAIGPLLALLMLLISLTFDVHAIRRVLARPEKPLLAAVLVYVPMSLLGWLTGRAFFAGGALAAGQTLVGALPTDVSSPLLVLMARGNVAMAAVFNAFSTALSPLIVPFLFVWLTGIELASPLGAIVGQLVMIVLLPTLLGVTLRTGFGGFFARFDDLYAGLGSLVYLLILLAVVGPNAATILGYGAYALVIAAAALCLNLAGYAVGLVSRFVTRDRQEVIAFLFTTSKKEFSIAAAFVAASGLPAEVAIPAAFFAVIQMITSPLAARLLVRR